MYYDRKALRDSNSVLPALPMIQQIEEMHLPVVARFGDRRNNEPEIPAVYPEFGSRHRSKEPIPPNSPYESPNEDEVVIEEKSRKPKQKNARPAAPTSGQLTSAQMILNIICLSLTIFCCSSPTAAVFNTAPPIVWKNTNKHVTNGTTLVYYELHAASPCRIYDQFGSFSRDELNKFMNWCESSYASSFLDPLNSICNKPRRYFDRSKIQLRSKRFDPITIGIVVTVGIVFAIGFIGLSIYNTVKYAQLSSEMEAERVKMNLLNTNQRHIKNAVAEIEETLKETIQKFNNFTADYQVFRSELPVAMMTTSDLSSKFGSFRDRMDIFKREWNSKRIAPEIVSLLNITIPCNGSCPFQSMSPIDCELDYENSILKLGFQVQEVDESEHILEADPFRYYTMNSTHACFLKYHGPTFVLFKDTDQRSCPLKLRHLDDNDIILPSSQHSCDMKPSDVTWKLTSSCVHHGDMQATEFVQVKKVGNMNHILCFGFSIQTMNQITVCPSTVFTLPSNISFKIDHLTYSATHVRTHSNMDVIPYWQHHVNAFVSPKMDPYHVNMAHFQNIDRDLDSVVTIPLSKDNIYLFGILLVIFTLWVPICFLVCKLWWSRRTDQSISQQAEEIPLNVFEPRNDDIELQRPVSHRRSATDPIPQVPADRTVRTIRIVGPIAGTSTQANE